MNNLYTVYQLLFTETNRMDTYIYLKPTDSIGSNKSLTSFEIFGPMARDIMATHANTIGSTVTAFWRLKKIHVTWVGVSCGEQFL